MRDSLRGLLQVVATMSALLLVGACADSAPPTSVDAPALAGAMDFIPPSGGPGDPDPTAFGKTPAGPDVERYEICKRWVGAPGVATFEVSGPVNTHQTSTDDGSWFGPFSALGETDWSCRDVWLEGAAGQIVTVTEIGASGTNPYTLTLVQALTSGSNNPATIGADFVSGRVDGFTGAGVTAFFTNTEMPPPPGGEGCTPGYWKQAHHFGSWTAPYTPGTLFSDVFEDAFPSMTLLDVLKQGGGGLKALGRHTVAALLNGASAGVAADYSAAQVIAGFNGVFPGTKSDYNTLKNQYAAANEQGCPLGRNP